MTSMTRLQATQLLEQFNSFHQALMEFVVSCSDRDWQRQTRLEGWPVSATAHHIGTAHYSRMDWVQMIANEQSPPKITFAEIDKRNAEHARESARLTQAEVAVFLQDEANKVVNSMIVLSDEQLVQKIYLEIIGGEISATQLFASIVIDSAVTHLESMRTVARA